MSKSPAFTGVPVRVRPLVPSSPLHINPTDYFLPKIQDKALGYTWDTNGSNLNLFRVTPHSIEALINTLGEGHYLARSAGSKPAGYVHPKSIETLSRHGINVDGPRSKLWDEFEGESFDLVITVCDQAAIESCPVFFGKHKTLHWSTPDPAKAQGSEDKINAAFDHAFTMLKNRIEKELL